MHKTMQQKAAEAHNMCKLKGDSMLDNSDRQIAFEAVYDSEEQAQQAVEFSQKKQISRNRSLCYST
ncbi:Protein of uncharacterised function (DUF406) [Actinobacillus equuli]|nr:Protein of uncharacterised function (DUF406) [Actinobacillus equuli]